LQEFDYLAKSFSLQILFGKERRTLQHDHFKRSWVLALGLVWLMLLGVKASIAQEKSPVAGEMVLAVIKYQEINVRDTKGHALFLVEYEGNNVSRGKQEFMNKSQVGMLLFGDLENRNGPIQGYFEFRKKGDTVFSKWEGKLITSYSSKGTPVTTFEGTFSYTKGTGQYAGIQGRGVFKGKMISWEFRTFEWEGEYWIKR
jgi:hypothetical protein